MLVTCTAFATWHVLLRCGPHVQQTQPLHHPQAYDSMGHAAFENMEATGGAAGGPGQGPFGGGPFGQGVEIDPEELFGAFFGGGRGRGGGAAEAAFQVGEAGGWQRSTGGGVKCGRLLPGPHRWQCL